MQHQLSAPTFDLMIAPTDADFAIVVGAAVLNPEPNENCSTDLAWVAITDGRDGPVTALRLEPAAL